MNVDNNLNFGGIMNENNSHKPNIRSICAGYKHTVALKSDGTVFAIGLNTYGQCNVGEWHDIITMVAANAHTGNGHTVGLRKDGTVIATGWNKHNQCNVDAWHDIIAIAAGWRRTLAITSDRTVVAIGQNKEGQCDVET